MTGGIAPDGESGVFRARDMGCYLRPAQPGETAPPVLFAAAPPATSASGRDTDDVVFRARDMGRYLRPPRPGDPPPPVLFTDDDTAGPQ